MHETTVRFDDATWLELSADAERNGVPKAQVIREATIAHLAVRAERRDLAELRGDLAELRRRMDTVERLLRRTRAPRP